MSGPPTSYVIPPFRGEKWCIRCQFSRLAGWLRHQFFFACGHLEDFRQKHDRRIVSQGQKEWQELMQRTNAKTG